MRNLVNHTRVAHRLTHLINPCVCFDNSLAGDRFIYDQFTGNLFFDTDGLGGAAQVKLAQLSNQAALTVNQIYVIA